MLRQAYLAYGASFFRDSAGGVWPLPYTNPRVADRDEDLAQAITRLIADAGADVESPESAVETNIHLWQRIRTSPLPTVINADDVVPR